MMTLCGLDVMLVNTHTGLRVMDTDLFAFDLFYDTQFTMDKATRLSMAKVNDTCYAFTGVDLDLNGNPVKWRAENSWGIEMVKKVLYNVR